MNNAPHSTDKRVPYKIVRDKRRKSVALEITESGEIKVLAPHWVPKLFLKAFVKSNLSKLKEGGRLKTSGDDFEKRYPYEKYKEEARKVISERVAELNKNYGFSYNKIAIRRQKTRWGSCSSNKNLNFNYRLLFLPPELRDYVIVHELCHLKEMNHSKRFWSLVEKTIPGYKKLRKDLKTNYGLGRKLKLSKK